MTDSTFPRNRSWSTERRRLAMELHDNLGQRLALLAAEIGVLRQQLAKGATTPEATISVAYQTAGRLADHTADIGFEVHRISHGLRRTSLDLPELTAALERLSRDMAHAHGSHSGGLFHRVLPAPNRNRHLSLSGRARGAAQRRQTQPRYDGHHADQP